MVTVKKKLIFLCEYPFTEHTAFKMEINQLKKKGVDIIINDLSKIIYGNNFSSAWKTPISKKSLRFSSLLLWIFYFYKLDKRNIVLWNNIRAFNFNSFIIELILRIYSKNIILNHFYDIFSKPQKKTFKVLSSRILYHKFNFGPYLHFFKVKFLRFILNFFPYKKVYFLSNNFNYLSIFNAKINKLIKINFNSYDYSNFLTFKNKKNRIKKKYAIYLDGGGPYFSGDRLLNNTKLEVCDFDNYYGSLNFFFKKLENYLNINIFIIPHPKFKSQKNKSLNPYFDNKRVINDVNVLPKLSSNCLFFINYKSTAQSFAIAARKPIILIYSSKYHEETPMDKSVRKHLSKHINNKIIDICNFKISEVKKCIKVHKKKYDDYKYNFLTPKNKSVENIPNYKILEKLIKKI